MLTHRSVWTGSWNQDLEFGIKNLGTLLWGTGLLLDILTTRSNAYPSVLAWIMSLPKVMPLWYLWMKPDLERGHSKCNQVKIRGNRIGMFPMSNTTSMFTRKGKFECIHMDIMERSSCEDGSKSWSNVDTSHGMPMTVRSHQKLEEDSSQELLQDATLIAHWFQTSTFQIYQRINSYRLKPLSLWWFVKIGLEN